MSPLVISAIFLPLLWLSARVGAYVRSRLRTLEEVVREDLGVILAAALTLLGLVIGFTFSMAVSRYDQRLKYEAAEANAIDTALLRTSLLPAADGAKVRELLMQYATQRVLFYETRNPHQVNQINLATARLQTDLWSTVQSCALAQPTPITALAVASVNDVFDSHGNAQAAWQDRIPIAAWTLIGGIAVFCNVLLGYTSRRAGDKAVRLLILPILVSCSLSLIADLESPYGGVIHMVPRNLNQIVHPL
jgi:hypothetical protein